MTRLLLSIILSIVTCGSVFAESVFLLDGSIVEGKIVRENDSGVMLRKYSDSREVSFKYNDIIRISYDNDYRKKSYIRLKNGKVLSGYIVEQTKTHYICRTSLNSPNESRFGKDDVVTLSQEQFMSKGIYYSLGIFPGAAQLYSKRDLSGGIFLASSLASFAFTGYSYYDFRKKRNAYRSLNRGESPSRFDSKYDSYRKSSMKLVYSLCVSGIVYAANWFDVLYHGRGFFENDSDSSAESSAQLHFSLGSGALLCRGNGLPPTGDVTTFTENPVSFDELRLSLGAVMRF
ncbi:MAG TPA: hypothetical protein PKK43_10375 [Spirochaetota bacterium]|nr:hypothetical protein [Spirochaetota bacterium]